MRKQEVYDWLMEKLRFGMARQMVARQVGKGLPFRDNNKSLIINITLTIIAHNFDEIWFGKLCERHCKNYGHVAPQSQIKYFESGNDQEEDDTWNEILRAHCEGDVKVAPWRL